MAGGVTAVNGPLQLTAAVATVNENRDGHLR